jgi:hypothetical protein
MADWYAKTVLTVVAICVLFLAGHEAFAPSRNYELSQIVCGLSDLSLSIGGLDKGDSIQRVAICDQWGNCVDARSRTGNNGITHHTLPVDASEPCVSSVSAKQFQR